MDDAGQLERRVGALLRGGVILAALVIVAGLALFALRGDPALTATGDFTRAPEAGVHFARSPRAVIAAAGQGAAGGVIQLGLLLLMSLPVVRVAATVVLFLAARERALAAIAFCVLLLLSFGAR